MRKKKVSYYSNVTDPIIFPLIIMFISCREKALTKNSIVKIQKPGLNREPQNVKHLLKSY